MTKLEKNPIQKVLDVKNYQEKVTKAKDRFRFKPYSERYAGLNITAKMLRYFLPLFSIATGTLFLSVQLSNIVPIQFLAVAFAVMLIVVLEYTKATFLDDFFELFYANTPNYAGLVIALLLACLSAFVSLQGVRELHKQVDTSLHTLADNQRAQQDSVRAYYDSQIATTKKELSEFKSSITWNGKINMYNPANTKMLTDYSAQVSTLQAEKAKALDQLSQLHGKQSTATEQASGFNLIVVVGIIALIEMCILLANWYVIFFDFKTSKQAETLTKNQSNILLDVETFQSSVMAFMNTTGLEFTLQPEQISPTASPRIIGFNPTDKSIDTDSKKGTETSQNSGIDTRIDTSINTGLKPSEKPEISLKDRQFLEAYKPIVDDLQKGKSYGSILKTDYSVTDLRTNKQVTKRISKTTLQNINRVLNNI